MHSDLLAFHSKQITPLLITVLRHVEQLVVLTGGSWEVRTALMQSVAQVNSLTYYALGLPLAHTLLSQPPRQRPLFTLEMIQHAVESAVNGLALDQIEILFDPDLHIDPLHLAQSLSRRRLVLLSWPGKYQPGRLTYAEPNHFEYRTYQLTDELVYSLETSI
jgi:hypothetical protein